MAINSSSILLLLVLLQVKHAIFDGPLQLAWMLREKGIYGRAGGMVHAGLHGLGSGAAFLLFGLSFWMSALLTVVDAVAHYHVDYAKESMVRRRGWTTEQPYFWWALTADQMFHQFTYLAICAVTLRLA